MLINILIFVAILSILVIVHELGHFLLARRFFIKVEEFGIGFPPRVFSWIKNGTRWSINAIPLGGFVKILGEEGKGEEGNIIALQKNEYSFSQRPIWQRAYVLAGGVFMNFVLGWIILSALFMFGSEKAILISQVSDGSPASVAGIVEGDRVIGLESVDSAIKFINENKGKEIVLKIERGGKEFEIKITPRENPPIGEGALGVGLIGGGMEKMSFFKSIWEALKSSASVFAIIFVMLFKLILSIFNGGELFSQVSGPIGIFNATAQASSFGFSYLASFVAFISINLAALNIFPFPALDGGRILFLIIEKIKGSPISQRTQQFVNAAGFALLIILIIYASAKDIMHLTS